MSGLPNSNTLATYGGQKQNRQQPANVTFDYDASQNNQAFSDLAGITHTIPRISLVIQLGSFTGSVQPTLLFWDATWKVATPTTPVLSLVSQGISTITFPTVVTDENGTSTALNLIAPQATLMGNQGFFISVTPNTNILTVSIRNASNSLSDSFVGQSISIGCR